MEWSKNELIYNGKYTIQARIGKGGFGVTYRAFEKPSGKFPQGRIVAIKTLNDERQQRPNFKDLQTKFLNEAMLQAKCHHPHIADIYEVFHHDDLWCIAMEYIEGTRLDFYLEDKGVLSVDESLMFISQIGKALKNVHDLDFLHRDIKPQNIILRKANNHAILIDFGLVREFSAIQTMSMTSQLTAGYAPIEQYEKRAHFGPYTDIYALGVTLYVLLTNQPVLPANYRQKHPELKVDHPREHNNKISQQLNDAIMWAIALQPEDRPQSIDDWFNALGLGEKKPQNPINLVSQTTGIDYSKLQQLLANKNWPDADLLTWNLMKKAPNPEEEGCLTDDDCKNFPREDLKIMDDLWVKYSEGKFGFSVQKEIFIKCGGVQGEVPSYDIYCKFADAIGWRKDGSWLDYDEITYNTNATSGHLPLGFLGRGLGYVGYPFLLSNI
jgi:eukaryotic-like serine/threonine-protein kinase